MKLAEPLKHCKRQGILVYIRMCMHLFFLLSVCSLNNFLFRVLEGQTSYFYYRLKTNALQSPLLFCPSKNVHKNTVASYMLQLISYMMLQLCYGKALLSAPANQLDFLVLNLPAPSYNIRDGFRGKRVWALPSFVVCGLADSYCINITRHELSLEI